MSVTIGEGVFAYLSIKDSGAEFEIVDNEINNSSLPGREDRTHPIADWFLGPKNHDFETAEEVWRPFRAMISNRLKGCLNSQKAGQAGYGGQAFKIANKTHNLFGTQLREACEIGAAIEFLRDLVITHWVGGAAFAEIRPARNSASILQLDVDQRRHFMEACPLGLFVHQELNLFDHGLHIRSLHGFIAEFLEAGLPLEQEDRHAKLHGEFRLEFSFGT